MTLFKSFPEVFSELSSGSIAWPLDSQNLLSDLGRICKKVADLRALGKETDQSTPDSWKAPILFPIVESNTSVGGDPPFLKDAKILGSRRLALRPPLVIVNTPAPLSQEFEARILFVAVFFHPRP